MGKRGKNYRAATEGLTSEPLALADAVALAKEKSFAKFDESLEMALRLGVDPKHADQTVPRTI